MTTPTPGGIAQEIAWARLGANLIVHSADAIAVRMAMNQQIGHIRAELGDGSAESQGGLNI
jgi:hypothetical protein